MTDTLRVAMYVFSNNNPYYYLSDAIGSTSVISSGDGKAIEWDADYYPYGGEQVYTSRLTNYYQFTGYEKDFETGYHYAVNRIQSPNLGRFFSPDPIPGDIFNPQSLNRYAYVMNDPSNDTDPLGLRGKRGDNDECYRSSLDGTEVVPCGGFPSDDAANAIALSMKPVTMDVYYWGKIPSQYWNSPHDTFGMSYRIIGENGWIPGSISLGLAGDSWAWTFTKSFFGGLVSSAGWKAVYKSVVDEGGCDHLMFSTFAGDLIPYPTDDTPGPTDAIEPSAKFLSAVTYNQGLTYAASKGLTYPFKSSVFRGFMDTSETIEGSVPAVTAGVATVHAVTKAGMAAYNGECY